MWKPSGVQLTRRYHGSWGRLKGISYFPVLGNHDVCEDGPGAPSWRAYFADQLANLPCTQQTPPCRPDLGYYDRDLDVNSDGRPDWYILVLDSDCQRFNGSTGDTETAACGDGSPQHEWLGAAMGRRHGGQTSGQKCSIAIWHHERWGTTTFGDDPSTQQFILTLNHFHNDIILSGHAHSLARLGAMTGTASWPQRGKGSASHRWGRRPQPPAVPRQPATGRHPVSVQHQLRDRLAAADRQPELGRVDGGVLVP